MEHVTFKEGEFSDSYVADDGYVLTQYQEGDKRINYAKRVIVKKGNEISNKFYAMLETEAKTIADEINPKHTKKDHTTTEEETKSAEETEEEALQAAKDAMIKTITEYDISDNVNTFIFNGMHFWLDKETRIGLDNSTNKEIAVGRTDTTLILGDTIVTIPCTTLLQMLTQLEVYAKDCYNVTAQHKIDVKALTSIDEVSAFKYTEGYPEVLTFTL